MTVNLNGEVATFEPGAITQINVFTGSGANNVTVLGTPSGVLTSIDDGGNDTVDVGAGTTAGINGIVQVFGAGATILVVDDSLDTTSQTVSLNDGYMEGLSPADIEWVPTSSSSGGVTALVVYGGSGGNTFNVNNTSNFYGSTLLNTGTGSDIVNIYATTGSLYDDNPGGLDYTYVGGNRSLLHGPGDMSSINGSVYAYGAGSTYLVLEDQTDSTGRTVSMYDGAVYGLSSAVIEWSPSSSSTGGVTYLVVYGGTGGNTFNIYNTSNFYAWTHLNTGTGNDTLNIYATTSHLDEYNDGGTDVVNVGLGNTSNINGYVYAYGAGSTALVIDDSNDATSRTVTMSGSSVTGLAPAAIEWTPTSSSGGVTALTIDGGSGNNTYTIASTQAGTAVTLNTGSGSDNLIVSDAANTLDSIQGSLTVNGNGSNTTLTVDDSGNPNAENYTVNPTSIQRSTIVGGVYEYNTAAINYFDIGHVVVYVGTDQTGQNQGGLYNTLDVTGSEAGTVYDLYANSAVNSQTLFAAYPWINAGTGAYNPNNQILGPIHFHGLSPQFLDEVTYDDFFDQTAQTYTMTAGQIVDNGFAPVTYDGPLYSVGLITGNVGGSKVNLKSTTSSWNVVVANAKDVVTLGSKAPTLGGTLANIASNVTIDTISSTQRMNVVLDDSGDTQSRQVTFSNDGYAWGISGLTSSRIYFGGHLVGSGSSIQVHSGTGNTTFALQGPTPTGVSLSLIGGSGNNTLQGANLTNTWTISGANTGKVGNVSFSHVQNLIGGTGVDTFKFSGVSAKVSSINGGGAPAGQGDWLNYASFTSSSTVTVNLATGSATNVNGGAAGAVTGIQNAIGSGSGTNNLTGNSLGNILIGGSGLNTIVGGSGNSLLIGGSGHGSITGGSGQDILIAGTTTYDATGQNALMAILDELQSTDSFATKVNDLIHGGGLNGKSKLTWGVSGATVKASNGAFTLAGDTAAESTADWFFANSSSTVSDWNDDGVNDEHNNNALGVF